MVSARISKESMSGIKILQDRSHDKATIVQIISQLVHKELMDRDLAIFSSDGYHAVGERIIDPEGKEMEILMIDNGVATFIDDDGKFYTSMVSNGAAWRCKGAKSE